MRVGACKPRAAATLKPVFLCESAGRGMPDNRAASLNNALIDALKQRGDLLDARVEAAFRAVPRHLFLPAVPLEDAYKDEAIPVKLDSSGAILSSCSQPAMIAGMLGQLRLRPGMNVLEIGAGTGYSAALMQHMVGNNGRVTSIELDADLVRQAHDNLQRVSLANKVHIVHADGAHGYAPRAAYDRIIATAVVWDVPRAWVQQLKPNGLLIAPIWLDTLQMCAAFRLQPDGTLYSDQNIPCGFVRLRGPTSGPNTHKRIGSTPLVLVSNHIDVIDPASMQMLLSEDAEINYLGMSMSAGDYWHGFLPYLMLNIPEGQTFGLYHLLSDQPAFGIEGHGFALIAPGSAAFVPYKGEGTVHCFAGADAFIALQDSVSAWMSAGRPNVQQLRVQLSERGKPLAARPGGRAYDRPYHQIHVWFAPEGNMS